MQELFITQGIAAHKGGSKPHLGGEARVNQHSKEATPQHLKQATDPHLIEATQWR